MKPVSEQQIETVTLNKIKVAMQKLVDERLLMDTHFDIAHWSLEQFSMELKGYLLGEDVQRKEITYPCDWWQAFKDHWFPAWAKRRWPILYKTEVLDAKLLYTQFKPALPREPYRIDISKWGH